MANLHKVLTTFSELSLDNLEDGHEFQPIEPETSFIEVSYFIIPDLNMPQLGVNPIPFFWVKFC